MSVLQTANTKQIPTSGVIYGFDPTNSNTINAVFVNANGQLLTNGGTSSGGTSNVTLLVANSPVTANNRLPVEIDASNVTLNVSTISNVAVSSITNGLPTGANTLGSVIISVGGSSLSNTNPVPIFDAFQTPTTISWANNTTINTTMVANTSGYDTVIFTIAPTSTLTGGAITFEAFDGYNWVVIKAPRTDSYSTDSIFTLSGNPGTHSWQLPIAGYPQVRARLSTAMTGTGSVTLVSIVSSAPDVSLVTVGVDPASTLPGFATPPAFVSSNPSTIYSNTQTSTLSAVALPSQALTNGIVLTTYANNTGTIYVGQSGVTTATGYPLAAGQSISYGVTNLSAIYIIGTNTTDKIAFTGN